MVVAAAEVAVVEVAEEAEAATVLTTIARRKGSALGPKILYALGRRGPVKTLLGNTKSMVDVT